MTIVFALSGLSESGKSTAGRYLDSVDVERLKIVRFMNDVKDADGAAAEDYGEWIERARARRRDWLNEQFTDRLLDYVSASDRSAVSIESLYDPVLSQYLKRRLGPDHVVLFIDIPREVRLRRQMVRESLATIEEAAGYLDPRDAVKIGWGALKVRAMADEIVDNSGSLQELYDRLGVVLKKHAIIAGSPGDPLED